MRLRALPLEQLLEQVDEVVRVLVFFEPAGHSLWGEVNVAHEDPSRGSCHESFHLYGSGDARTGLWFGEETYTTPRRTPP